MSLMAWFPLDGSLKNQGLDYNITLSTQTAKWGALSKIGANSLDIKNGGTLSGTIPSLTGAKKFSVAFWIYSYADADFTSDWVKCLILGDKKADGTSGSNLRFEGCWGTTTRTCSWHNNTAYALSNGTYLFGPGRETWYHVTLTADGENLSSYTNGIFKHSVAQNDGYLSGTFTAGGTAYRGYISDLRFYDHCLSPREVKEISQGLFLHYPLNDIYSSSLVNKYSGEVAQGKASNKTGTKKYSEQDGYYYNYSVSYTGTGTNSWWNLQYPTFSFTVDKKHYYSVKIRMNKNTKNNNFMMRASRASNDWVTNSVSAEVPMDGKWHEVVVSQTIPTSFDRSGTTVTSKPLLEFYTGARPTSGVLYELDFDIKDVQVVESDQYAAFINNDYKTTTIYDCSGYKYNATAEVATGPAWDKDTPIGNGSYKFTNIKWIKGIHNFPLNEAGTVAFWFKSTSTTATQCIINHRNATGAGLAVFLLGGKLRFDTNTSATQWAPTYTYSADTWTHVVLTKDSANEKLYINGVLKNTKAYATTFGNLGSFFTIGASSAGSNTAQVPSSNPMLGNIADFRIYSTALSAADIKNLYEARFSIDANGDIYCHEYIEDNDLVGVQFNKNGVLSAAAGNESVNTYDMELKTLSDGSQWARIFYHNNAAGAILFKSDAEVLETSSAYKYSKLKYLENFRSKVDNKFEFMLCYPTDTTAYNRWKQSDNPTAIAGTAGDGTIQAGGYEAVSIAWTNNYWGGLLKSSNNSSTFIDGSCNHGNWFYAIGAKKTYGNGIPSYSSTAGIVELWVRIDNLNKYQASIYKNAFVANEIIEF